MIDTHAHLFDEAFRDDLPEVMQRARAAGIRCIMLPNEDDTTIAPLLDVCSTYPDICFPVIGFHPTSVDGNWRTRLDRLRPYLRLGHPFVGIGEIGMDLYWDRTFRREQQEVLDRQIQWALEWDLPVTLHCRDAYPELFEVLSPYQATPLRGIFHCFTGTVDELEQCLSFAGFRIGVGGIATFRKSTLADTLRRYVPLERIVLETDAPDLAPVPHRGQRNEPAFVQHVARKIAETYHTTTEEVDRMTTKTAGELYKMTDLIKI